MVGRCEFAWLFGKLVLSFATMYLWPRGRSVAFTCKPPFGVFTPRISNPGILPWPWRRKTSSTASMQSGRLSSSSTSLRRTKSVASSFIGSSDQTGDFSPRSNFERSVTATKHSRAGFAFQRHCAILDSQPCSFANADDRRFIFLKELEDAFLLSFAHVGGIRIRIEIVGADLKGDQA